MVSEIEALEIIDRLFKAIASGVSLEDIALAAQLEALLAGFYDLDHDGLMAVIDAALKLIILLSLRAALADGVLDTVSDETAISVTVTKAIATRRRMIERVA